MQDLLDLLDYNMKIVIWWGKLTFAASGANKHLVRGCLVGAGGFFHMGGWANFWLAGRTPLIPQ